MQAVLFRQVGASTDETDYGIEIPRVGIYCVLATVDNSGNTTLAQDFPEGSELLLQMLPRLIKRAHWGWGVKSDTEQVDTAYLDITAEESNLIGQYAHQPAPGVH